MIDWRYALVAGLVTLAVSTTCSESSARNAGRHNAAEPDTAQAPLPVVPRPAPVATPASRPLVAGLASLEGSFTQGGWAIGRLADPRGEASFNGASLSVAADGTFFIAFDRDAAPAAALLIRQPGGKSLTQPLTISPRAWQIEHVAVGPRPGSVPSEEYQRRRAAELARINAARRINAQSDGWRQRFIWPVKGRLSGMFGSQRIYRGTPGSYHSGTDIATGGSGTPFVAPADGVVILAAESPFTLEGRLLMIDHGMGLNSAFLHSSQLLVKEGDRVRQGQVIGRIGMTGRATGPHLHWSMKWGTARIDPILFTGPMR